MPLCASTEAVQAKGIERMQEARLSQVFGMAPMEGLADVPAHAQGVLENALQRYLAMNCVTQGVIPLKQVLRDRTNFIHLYDANGDSPRLDDRIQVEFMHGVSGLPKAWCAYWTYMAWLNTLAAEAADGDLEDLVMEGYERALDITESIG